MALITRQCFYNARMGFNDDLVQGGMAKMEQQAFAEAKEKKADEKKKALMHSLFASLNAVKKVDEEGNSK